MSSIGSWIGGVVSGILNPVSNAYKANQDRKKARETGEAKLKLAKENNDTQLDMTQAEWEALSKKNEDGSWKDEWVTIITTLPIPIIFLSAIASAYLGDPLYLESAKQGVTAIKELLPNYEGIVEVVIYAALSIKGFNIIRR